MGTLIATYVVALAGVGAYAVWLAVAFRRQAQRLAALQKHSESEPDNLPKAAGAA